MGGPHGGRTLISRLLVWRAKLASPGGHSPAYVCACWVQLYSTCIQMMIQCTLGKTTADRDTRSDSIIPSMSVRSVFLPFSQKRATLSATLIHGEHRGGHAAASTPPRLHRRVYLYSTPHGTVPLSRDGGTEQAGRFRARRVVLVTVPQPEEVLIVDGLRAPM